MERPKEIEDDTDPGRSRERAEQDRMLDREARRESWITRLLRHDWFAKGRPNPRARSDDERDRRSE